MITMQRIATPKVRPPVLALLVALAAGCAAPGATAPSPGDGERAAAAFERLKGLEGSWRGDFAMGEMQGPAEVRYRVTSGGSAVEEVLFGGTPHEMVTMYHLDGPRLMLTHYCAAGNQPSMVLAPDGEDGVLRFEFLRATNMASPDEGHMHEAVLDLSNPGRLRSAWTYWEGGKAGHEAVIEVTPAE